MAKKWLAGAFCLCTLFLCTCQSTASITSMQTSVPPSSTGMPSSASAQSDAIPTVPELGPYVTFDVPAFPFYDYDTCPPLLLKYEIYSPDQGFLAALSSLTDAQRIASWDSNNYIEIGSYVLFSITNPLNGLSCLMVDDPNGPPQVLFETSQIITKVSASQRGTLILGLIYWDNPMSGTIEYYELNLQNKTLTLLDYPDADSSYGYYCSIYCEQYYLAAITDTTGGADHSLTIFSVSSTGNRTPLVDSVYAHTFMDGRIYYLHDDRIRLYSMALDGTDKTLVHTFESPIHIHMMGGTESFGMYPYEISDEGYGARYHVLDVHSGKSFQITPQPLYLSQDGYYIRSDAESILYYIPYNGTRQSVLANFKAEYGRVAVIGSWVYFTAQVSGNNSDGEPVALQWKIKLDGSELTLLSPSPS